MTDPISRPAVLDALHAVVAEAGSEHVYARHHGPADEPSVKTCTYVHDGQPDCIVGRALHRLGVSVDDLARLDSAGGMSTAIAYVADLLSVPLGPWALRALAAAQDAQDQGRTWGDSLVAAERAR